MVGWGEGRVHAYTYPQRRMVGWFHVVSLLLLVLKRTITPTKLKAGALGTSQHMLLQARQLRDSLLEISSGENVHEADRKDEHYSNLSPGCSLEVPDRLDWHEEDDKVSQSIADTTRIEQCRYIDTSSFDRLVPYPFPWRAFPDFYNRGRKIEKT